MTDISDNLSVLSAYGEPFQGEAAGVIRTESLGSSGGFSGAKFWRLATPGGVYCLRRWPKEHPSSERLETIHAVLRYVAARGEVPLPIPLLSESGHSCVIHEGHLWQLEPWMPGETDSQLGANPVKLIAAMTMLGQFHRATQSFPSQENQPLLPAPAAGIVQRLQRLQQWSPQALERLARAVGSSRDPTLQTIQATGEKILSIYRQAAPSMEQQLNQASGWRVPQQPCLRDIHDQHVLFTGDEVSGLIDFGSLRMDHRATDVARLLGSTAGDNLTRRQAALAAYEAIWPLEDIERELVEIYDRSAVLLSGLFWLEWLFIDQRRFEDLAAVEARLTAIHSRLAFVGSIAQ